MIHKKIVESQYLNFDDFLNDIDFIVVMVSHSHLKQHIDKINGKIVLDTQNIVFGANTL